MLARKMINKILKFFFLTSQLKLQAFQGVFFMFGLYFPSLPAETPFFSIYLCILSHPHEPM